MKLEMRKLAGLAKALADVGNLTGIKFCYAVAKNTEKIEDELKALGAGLKQSKRFKEYEKERLELCEEHGEKDENGNAKMMPTPGGREGQMEYVGIANNAAFQKEFKALRKRYKDELDERTKAAEEYQDALDDEIDFEFYMINKVDIPKGITAAQYSGIIRLVSDGDEKTKKKVSTKKKE